MTQIINSVQADPTQPHITTKDRFVSLLPPNSKDLEHALASITAKLEYIPVPFEILWDVDKAPSSFLIFLAYAWSVDEWNDNWTDATKRAVIKNSLWVHQKKGTLGAVKRALQAMGYKATVTEWFEKTPTGTPGTFSIEVEPLTSKVADSLQQIRAMINAVKRLSAHYDVFFGTKAEATIATNAIACTGVIITITN